MNISNKSYLSEICAGLPCAIDFTSPEIRFMEAVCSGRADDAVALMRDSKQFGGLSAVDAPYGRFEGISGISGISEFARGWLNTFRAESAAVRPVYQTRANGRSVTEMDIDFVIDGEIYQAPMFVVGDLRAHGMLDEVRIYCNFSHVPGLTPYRKPIFKSAHLEMGDPNLLTGAVREYYEALHHFGGVDVDRIMASMGEGCTFGGYEPSGEKPHSVERTALRGIYERMSTYIPAWVGMRYETIVDNNVNCVIEWQHIVSDQGVREGSRVCLSGISSYTRGEDGLLASIRICDYAGFEKRIDWTKTPLSKEEAYSINRVRFFPDGVGER